jgi:hypothetical protein
MLTRSKVAYDLNISPHRINMAYDNQEIIFVFSSDLYKRKFHEKIAETRKYYNDSLTNRFGIHVSLDMLTDFKLYTTIEKRGFLLIVDGDKIECQNNITFVGGRMIAKH